MRRAAWRRDIVWMALWRLQDRGDGWATTRQVYEAWRDGREECGIIFVPDWPGHNIGYVLRRLADDGRAERRRRPGKMPEFRALLK